MCLSFYTEHKFLTKKLKEHQFFIIDSILYSKTDLFKLTKEIDRCDYAIFPLDIIYTVNKIGLKEIQLFLELAKKANKKTWIFSSGDFGLSYFDTKYDLIHFRLSGFKTKFKTKTEIIPPFIKDPYHFQNDYNTVNINPLTIGFVGHANGSIQKLLKEFVLYIYSVFLNFTGMYKCDYQSFYPSSVRRYNYILKLKTIKLLKTNFVLRNRYRAGAKKNSYKRKTTEKEFFNNIKRNLFTFCMRGGGNYSVRFYETLACGRIPLYVDTNAKLPLENSIDWKKHIIIVKPFDNINAIEEKIKHFVSKHDLNKVQISNRNLWLSYLTKKQYLRQLYDIYK